MQMGKKTTILLADDQHIVRQGIRHFLELEEDFEVVGEADNTLDAVRLTHEFKPDVIITEALRPTLGGVEAIRQCKAEHPQAAIIILTMCQEEGYITELLRVGARGYLLKTTRIEELVHTIRSVCAGEFVCDPAMMQRILKRNASPQPVAIGCNDHLTPREAEVLKLAARMSNRDIAGYLGIAEHTVKGHITAIFQKLNVDSRTWAVTEAIKQGWISLEDE